MKGDYQKKIEAQFLIAYDDLADSLFRHCYFKVGDKEKAKDIVQETFMKTWNSLVSGEVILNLKAYLYKVANNLIIDFYRKKKESSLDSLTDEGFDVADDSQRQTIHQAEVTVLREAIGKLEDQFREVVSMRYVSGLSPQEIATVLGESENAVSVRINRGVKKLKEQLHL